MGITGVAINSPREHSGSLTYSHLTWEPSLPFGKRQQTIYTVCTCMYIYVCMYVCIFFVYFVYKLFFNFFIHIFAQFVYMLFFKLCIHILVHFACINISAHFVDYCS